MDAISEETGVSDEDEGKRHHPVVEAVLAAGGDTDKIASLTWMLRQEIAEKGELAASELDLMRGCAINGNNTGVIYHAKMAILFQRFISFCVENLERSVAAEREVRSRQRVRVGTR